MSQDERNEEQERLIEYWAKEQGIWHEDAEEYASTLGVRTDLQGFNHNYISIDNHTILNDVHPENTRIIGDNEIVIFDNVIRLNSICHD